MSKEKEMFPEGEHQSSPSMEQNQNKLNTPNITETGRTLKNSSDNNPVSVNNRENNSMDTLQNNKYPDDSMDEDNTVDDVNTDDNSNQTASTLGSTTNRNSKKNELGDTSNKTSGKANNIDSSKYEGNDKNGNKENEKTSDKNSKSNDGESGNKASDNNNSSQDSDKKDKSGRSGSDDSKGVKLPSGVGTALKVANIAGNAITGTVGALKRAFSSDDPFEQAKSIMSLFFAFCIAICTIFIPIIAPSILGYSIISSISTGIRGMNKSASEGNYSDYYNVKYSNMTETALKEHKEKIDIILEDTVYPDALAQAKALCENLGYDWSETEKNMEETSSAYWDSVWGNINYADLIAGVNISYTALNKSTSEDEVDIETLMRAPEVYEHLYYLTYVEKEIEVETTVKEDTSKSKSKSSTKSKDSSKKPKTEKKIVKKLYIKINPFALEDLAAIGDMQFTDTIIDHKYLTYETKINTAKKFLMSSCSDEVIELLHMKNITEKYHQSEFTVYDRQEIFADIDLGDFDTSEWYSSTEGVIGTSKPDAKPSKLFNNWLRLYDAPTMATTGRSFYVNAQKARADIAADIATSVDNISNSSAPFSWSGYEFSSSKYWKSSMQGVTWFKDDSRMLATDYKGRYLVAVAPGVMKANYWSETGGVQNNAEWYHYQSAYLDIVVKEKSTGKVYYIPCHVSDSKGHAFPYGLVQTGIATPRTASQQVQGAVFNAKSIKARDFGINRLGSVERDGYKSIMNNYSNKLYEAEHYTMYQWTTHGMIEFCWVGDKKIPGSLNSSFELLGIVTY